MAKQIFLHNSQCGGILGLKPIFMEVLSISRAQMDKFLRAIVKQNRQKVDARIWERCIRRMVDRSLAPNSAPGMGDRIIQTPTRHFSSPQRVSEDHVDETANTDRNLPNKIHKS